MRRVTGRTQQWDAVLSPDHLDRKQSSRSRNDCDYQAAACDGAGGGWAGGGGGWGVGGEGRNYSNEHKGGVKAGGSPYPPSGQEISDKASLGFSRIGVYDAAGTGEGGGVSPRGSEGGGKNKRTSRRTRRFVFQREVALHVSMSILSIVVPFSLSGSPWLASLPLSLWCFYNVMFLLGAKRANTVMRGFDRFKRSFVAAMEEFLPRRMLPVLSLSFLSVVVAVTLTAVRLGGSPLCLTSCHSCLSSWANAQPLSTDEPSGHNQACGFANGKELLAYYTVSQSAILIYLAVMAGILTCLAWRVSEEELVEREAAERRLLAQHPRAFELRELMILEHGRPGSSVRPETTRAWLIFGVVAACIFVLIGWRKWGELPRNAVTAVVMSADVSTTVTSVLILHVGFHGRLMALYEGNLQRVQFLSKVLREGISGTEEPWIHAADAWWSLRKFVLEEDLSLDYDFGGQGVSVTVAIVVITFVVAIVQIVREGFGAILSPPGSYCAYATVYMTICLVCILELATQTYLEQQLHAGYIEDYAEKMERVSSKAPFNAGIDGLHEPPPSTLPQERQSGLLPSQPFFTGSAAYGTNDQRYSAGNTREYANSFVVERESERRRNDDGIKTFSNPNQEAIRQIVLQIKKSKPYPCVVGIPIKPASFFRAKLYAFVFFAMVSLKIAYDTISSF